MLSSLLNGKTYYLVSEIATDGALTVGQASRYAGSEEVAAAIRGGLATIRTEEYRPTAKSRRVLAAPVLRLTSAGEDLARALGMTPQCVVPRKLAHALGLAELRALLGIRPAELLTAGELEALWNRYSTEGHGLADGVARRGRELLALEYDHGSYKVSQIRQKLALTAALADRVIWGTPSLPRARKLWELGANDVRVVTVPLWPS